MPKVLPFTSYPRKRSGDHPDSQLPILTCLSALTIFLAAERIKEKVRSAVVLANTFGVFVTIIFLFVAS